MFDRTGHGRRRRALPLDFAQLQPVGGWADAELRADLHGHAVAYACDLDRAYFVAHPDAAEYLRPPVAHEWCRVPDGRGGFATKCLTPTEEPVAVLVQWLADGFRTRIPLAKRLTP